MNTDGFIPLALEKLPAEQMRTNAEAFYKQMETRRTVRDFSEEAIPEGVLESCVHAAGQAPSGANMQPWHFVIVRDAAIKREIRLSAEAEEREFYERRAPEEWLNALVPFGTDASKPFLETAPALIAIFEQRYHLDEAGERVKHYYPTESVGLATGFLIAGLHQAGLATLTHTPSPMKFLNKILGRGENERAFLLLVVGYSAEGAKVPDIKRKGFEEIATVLD